MSVQNRWKRHYCYFSFLISRLFLAHVCSQLTCVFFQSILTYLIERILDWRKRAHLVIRTITEGTRVKMSLCSHSNHAYSLFLLGFWGRKCFSGSAVAFLRLHFLIFLAQMSCDQGLSLIRHISLSQPSDLDSSSESSPRTARVSSALLVSGEAGYWDSSFSSHEKTSATH